MGKRMYAVTLSGYELREFEEFLDEYFDGNEVEYSVSNPDGHYGKDFGFRKYTFWIGEIVASVIHAFLEDHADRYNFCGCLECLG